jgi:hypothetical protein
MSVHGKTSFKCKRNTFLLCLIYISTCYIQLNLNLTKTSCFRSLRRGETPRAMFQGSGSKTLICTQVTQHSLLNHQVSESVHLLGLESMHF